MRLKLDWRKSAQENAASYYSLAKGIAAKERGAQSAIEETKKAIAKAVHEKEALALQKQPVKMKRNREWFERYKWFFTSGGKLALAGRDARQNDLLVAKVMAEGDLFFHADIQGAPATVLVGGKGATQQEKQETAQFAASHSSAWKAGAAAVDVYAVEKWQLSKHAQGGFVGAGAFAISGGREWFRATPLRLAVGKDGERVVCLPAIHPGASRLPFLLAPGTQEKGAAAKQIASSISADASEVLLALPAGKFSLEKRK